MKESGGYKPQNLHKNVNATVFCNVLLKIYKSVKDHTVDKLCSECIFDSRLLTYLKHAQNNKLEIQNCL